MTDPKDSEIMKKAEREVGQNIPREMIGLDTEDVGNAPDPPKKGVPAASGRTAEDTDKSA